MDLGIREVDLLGHSRRRGSGMRPISFAALHHLKSHSRTTPGLATLM